jgi:hypothetical protein
MSGGPGGEMPQPNVLVRWESALPILMASKKAPSNPDGQPQAYVISVSGMQMMGMGNRTRPGGQDGPRDRAPAPDMEGQMKAKTEIQRKGKDPLLPDRVEITREGDGPVFTCFFTPGSQAIRPTDKEVIFLTKMGPLEIKAKFLLKDMEFKGNLTL